MTDAELLREAAKILLRRSSRPNSIALKAVVRLLNNTAFNIEMKDQAKEGDK